MTGGNLTVDRIAQPLVAFLGDSPDGALVEDCAVSLAGMLQEGSLLRPALISTLQACSCLPDTINQV